MSKVDKTWSIKHEGHLNKNNIIFKDKKYKKLYMEMKKVDDKLIGGKMSKEPIDRLFEAIELLKSVTEKMVLELSKEQEKLKMLEENLAQVELKELDKTVEEEKKTNS
tara:strand:- start:15538 stop:15861 length:324 start_codon:yes stop_codon:yes gene_type:complete